jgi:hypothetical protein
MERKGAYLSLQCIDRGLEAFGILTGARVYSPWWPTMVSDRGSESVVGETVVGLRRV